MAEDITLNIVKNMVGSICTMTGIMNMEGITMDILDTMKTSIMVMDSTATGIMGILAIRYLRQMHIYTQVAHI
jgi:hypothetical protein